MRKSEIFKQKPTNDIAKELFYHNLAKELDRPKEIAFENEIYLFWYEKHSDTHRDIIMSQSSDGGKNFTSPRNISKSSLVAERYYRGLTFGKYGNKLLFTFTGIDSKGDKSELYFRQSLDNGQSLEEPIKLSDVPDAENDGTYISGSQDIVSVIWYEIDWDPLKVKLCLSHSRDSGYTFNVRKLPNMFASGVSSSRGRLYLLVEDMDPETFVGHVSSMYSDDGGISFSKAVQVSTSDKVETSVTDFGVLSSTISIVWNEYPLDKSAFSRLYSWSDNQGQSYSDPKEIK